jgi:DNA-binding CsgD family transcriptional regulator
MAEPLTHRQIQAIWLVAAGCTNDQIADRLKIGPESVKTHLKIAFRRLGANDRAHAVRLAHLAGYFESDPPEGCGDVRTRNP